MRVTIIVLMVTLGLFADFHVKKLVEKQKKIEALNVYQSTCFAAGHVLNDLLAQLELVKIEALRSSDFNQEIIKCYDIATSEASMLIDKLSSIKEITTDNIKESIAQKS